MRADAPQGSSELHDPGTVGQVLSLVGRATVSGLRHRRALADVERFCLFVGYPRSGHTLVGALLNAHAEVVVAHELDVLRFVRFGLRRHQLYALLLDRDRQFATIGRRWSGYDYDVPGQHQGSFRRLRVIGDKRAASTTNRLADRPELLDRLRHAVGVPLRIVHVVRNPFDNVATMARRRGGDLDVVLRRYARLGAVVETLRTLVGPDEFLDVRYESFVVDPATQLAELCRFVGVAPADEYLRACASLVHRGTTPSRHLVDWSSDQRAAVERLIADRPVLAGYTFADTMT